MDIAYASSKLERWCTNEKEMRKQFQPAICKTLRRRIKQLESASNLTDILEGLGKWHALTGMGESVYAATLSANWRIVVQFGKSENAVDVTVMQVVDYHTGR